MQPNLTHRDIRELGVVAAFWTLITATIFWPVVWNLETTLNGLLVGWESLHSSGPLREPRAAGHPAAQAC